MTRTNLIRRSFKGSLNDGEFNFGPPFKVPDHIARPHAKGKTSFCERVKQEDMDRVRNSARVAASALSFARSLTKADVTTEFIDHEVSKYIVSRSAYPSGIGFMGFPKAICQSVNEIIAHGIPDARPLQDGDIVNFDITAYKDGFYGDNSDTFLVGNVDQEGVKLVETTREALNAGIHVCKPGAPFSTIAKEIERVATRYGFGVVEYFCGHFIGREMHIAPNIHHTTNVELMEKIVMQPGMLFTIEPILAEGSTEAEVWKDGWTYVTKDKGRTAQAEHMVLITESGHEILTVSDEVF
jgi:methionyl aminopeptidase